MGMHSTEFALSKQLLFRAGAGKAKSTAASSAAQAVELTLFDDLRAVEREWQTFQVFADCTVFQTYEWLSCWQRNVGARAGTVPCIVMVRSAQGRLLMILPLAVSRRGIGCELVWLGSDLCDYNAPLLAADFSQGAAAADFQGLWDRILQSMRADPRFRFDMVRLEKMPEMLGGQRNPMLALPTALFPSGSYATPLAASWEEFYRAKRSSATRRRDRSKRNRLAEYGDIAFTTAATPDESLNALAILMAQKSAWFSMRGIPDLFARPDYVAFYRDFIGNPRSRGLAHVGQLAIGAETAATNFGLVFRGRYYYVLASYIDGEMTRLGPGVVHLQELFRYAIDRHCTAFDFTVGDERYKRDWCDGVNPLYDHLAASTWRGAIMIAPKVTGTWVKRMIKQTPWLWACVGKARALKARLLFWRAAD
jgi:CelD/BcsL family acetyltransferase involved in cellulose biosynthesis